MNTAKIHEVNYDDVTSDNNGLFYCVSIKDNYEGQTPCVVIVRKKDYDDVAWISKSEFEKKEINNQEAERIIQTKYDSSEAYIENDEIVYNLNN